MDRGSRTRAKQGEQTQQPKAPTFRKQISDCDRNLAIRRAAEGPHDETEGFAGGIKKVVLHISTTGDSTRIHSSITIRMSASGPRHLANHLHLFLQRTNSP